MRRRRLLCGRQFRDPWQILLRFSEVSILTRGRIVRNLHPRRAHISPRAARVGANFSNTRLLRSMSVTAAIDGECQMVFDSNAFDGHEEVVFASDKGCGLRAIIAVHSTAMGPAI